MRNASMTDLITLISCCKPSLASMDVRRDMSAEFVSGNLRSWPLTLTRAKMLQRERRRFEVGTRGQRR